MSKKIKYGRHPQDVFNQIVRFGKKEAYMFVPGLDIIRRYTKRTMANAQRDYNYGKQLTTDIFTMKFQG